MPGEDEEGDEGSGCVGRREVAVLLAPNHFSATIGADLDRPFRWDKHRIEEMTEIPSQL
jgi:hypothetical protein